MEYLDQSGLTSLKDLPDLPLSQFAQKIKDRLDKGNPPTIKEIEKWAREDYGKTNSKN